MASTCYWNGVPARDPVCRSVADVLLDLWMFEYYPCACLELVELANQTRSRRKTDPVARRNGEWFVNEINEAEARLYNHTTELFKGHEKLLTDTARNRAFYSALKRHVTKETSVLDIGSGTGVWAIVAARLGAKHVVAIEQDPLLIGLIKSLAKANGVSERIEAIAGDSRRIALGTKFDIVVSETIGNLAFEEQIVPIMIDARQRLLEPGGVLIPKSVSLVAAPAHLKSRHKKIPAGIAAEYDIFESLSLNIPVGLSDKSRLKLIGDPQDLARVDLATVNAMPEFADLTVRWEVEDASKVNCFAVWAEATLAEGISMAGIQTTSWTPLIYRLKPFSGRRGVLEFRLTLTAASNYWTATLSTGQDLEEQSYSPVYVASLLLAQSRTDDDLLGSPQQMSFVGRNTS